MVLRTSLLGLLLGCLITIFFMHQDAYVKERIGNAFKTMFETSVGCRMHCSVESVYLLQPALVLKNVRVTPHDEQTWYWTAQRLIVSCNWWHICCYGIIDLHVTLEDSHTYSAMTQGQLAIQDHINTLLFGTPSTIPLYTKSIIYKRAQMHLVDAAHDRMLHGTWNSESRSIDNHFKSTMYCVDAVMSNKDASNIYLQGLSGTVYCDVVSDNQKVAYTLDADCSAQLCMGSCVPDNCHIAASWKDNQGTVSITNDDHTLHGNLNIKKEAETVTAQGSCSIDNRVYQGISTGTINATYQITPQMWHGTLAWKPNSGIHIEGAWQWQQDRAQLDLTIPTHNPISIGKQWCIKPGTTGCSLTYTRCSGITCSYHSSLWDNYHDTQVEVTGNGSFTLSDAGWQGSVQSGAVKQDVCTVAVQNNTVSGSLHMNVIKEVIATLYGIQVQGDGRVAWTIADYRQSPLTVTALLDGTIRIPQTYNAINNARATLEWDYNAHTIRLRDVHAALYKGSCTCKQATVLYDASWRPSFVHAPFIVNDCLLNINKDLFALISGTTTYTYKDGVAGLTGLLTIDHSQLKENIFSQAFTNRFLKTTGMILPVSEDPIVCDIKIKTVTPTRVKTAFLDTAVNIDLHVTNTLTSPEVTGTIALGSGSLSFPYKPLYITQGTIHCVPGRLYDPIIEFSAKNSIKNHTISMHVTGSLAKPHVTLEAWPSLTQEQIVALLLVGSYQDSLNMVMPALVMNNVTSLLFGEHSFNAYTHKFASLLDPLKRIRFVPSFTDQTGRGGLRGAIEVDVSDRMHALIQKNFSLTEDTYFELGYQLSDDINVRLLRDERRDWGTEVEMRWKFGS